MSLNFRSSASHTTMHTPDYGEDVTHSTREDTKVL